MKFKISEKQKTYAKLAAGLTFAAVNAGIDWFRDHQLMGTYVFIGIIIVVIATFISVRKEPTHDKRKA